MEAVQTKDLTRAIGVSNFTITKTANLLKTAKMVPAVNQVECHPYFQQQKLKEYCDGVGECVLEYVRAENAPHLQTHHNHTWSLYLIQHNLLYPMHAEVCR